jgi:hypothetical protein
MKTFDPKCADLAEHFLQDLPWVDHNRGDDLAATIQQAIEDWIANEETNQEYPDPRDAEDWKRHAE